MAAQPRRLDARRHPGHPAQGRARPLPLPRHVDHAAGAELRRPDVPDVHALARPARGLPRALRHRDGARHALRRAAGAAEDPDHRLRHVVRRAVTQREGRHRPRRQPRGHLDHHRRRRHASAWSASNSDCLVYQICPSHYGNDAHDMASADAVEIVVGQGAKPGTGGVLLGAKVSDEVARMRDLPLGRRPALAGAPPRLHRSRRPAPQDRADPRGDRRADPGLRQDRRGPHPRRREAGRQGRRRRDRHRRHGGRVGRDARHPLRPHRHPDHGGRSARPAARSRTWGCSARCRSCCRAASRTAPTWRRRWRSVPTRSASARPS